MEVKLYKDLKKNEQIRVDEIFFESSAVREFSSVDAKKQFQYKYLDYYKIHHSDLFLVAYENGVLGYICGLADTQAEQDLMTLTPHLKYFENDYRAFPAHLHINLHANARGKGIGKILVECFCKKIMKQGVAGVNIITAPDARNVSFYKKCGFGTTRRYTRENIDLLFMGRHLEL